MRNMKKNNNKLKTKAKKVSWIIYIFDVLL